MLLSLGTKWKTFLALGIASGITLIGIVRLLKRRRKTPFSIKMLEELKSDSVHIQDPQRVENLIRAMIDGGKDKLQVIADFDRTLSRFKNEDGSINATCHNSLEKSHLLGQRYVDEALRLRDTYYPIEIDHSLTKAERYPYMVEWWTKAHDLLVEVGMTRDTVRMVAEESHITFRKETDWLFRELNTYNVPLLIFSAGLGDVIEEVIRFQTNLYKNVKVVSNYMEFNSQGILVGFKGDIIHTFNKNENAIHDSSYFSDLQHRDNIMLLGDSLGDLHMADGAVQVANILKIGFLNDKIDTLLPVYKESYDIVLVSDETFHVPNAIVKAILEN